MRTQGAADHASAGCLKMYMCVCAGEGVCVGVCVLEEGLMGKRWMDTKEGGYVRAEQGICKYICVHLCPGKGCECICVLMFVIYVEECQCVYLPQLGVCISQCVLGYLMFLQADFPGKKPRGRVCAGF